MQRGNTWSNSRHIVRGHRFNISCRAQLAFNLGAAEGHDKDGHPESAARLEVVQRAVEVWLSANPKCNCRKLAARSATRAELELVHPAAYLDHLYRLSDMIQAPIMLDDSTYMAPGSMDAIAAGTGAALTLVEHVMRTDSMGFALTRPPGHHVLPTRPMGFGLVNTVAIASRAAQQQTVSAPKCLILDFDVHHGNGTEEVFYDDPNVLYISTHQAGLWPYTGKLSSCGRGAGAGTTINIPLPGGSGDAVMKEVMSKVVWPAAVRFQPNVIIVSAGYDAHWADPLASMQLRTSTYRYLGQQLSMLAHTLCHGRLLLVLEGGYHLDSLAKSVVATCKGLIEGAAQYETSQSWTASVHECMAADEDDHALWLPEEPVAKAALVIQQVIKQHKL